MYYVYNVLSAILIGMALGSMVGRHSSAIVLSGLVAIILAVAAYFFEPRWIPLALGLAVFLVGQATKRDTQVLRT